MTTLTTDRIRLDASALKSAFSFPAGTNSVARWGEDNSIGLERTSSGFELSYSKSLWNGESERHVDQVRVDCKPCPFGGSRLFLICPLCAKPKAHLYGSCPFACRDCHGLIYPSQMEGDIYARYDRGQDIATSLAGRHVRFDEPFPQRPKGMHMRTYEALREKWDQLTLPCRALAGTMGLGDLADYSGEIEAGEAWRESMMQRRMKDQKREADRAERNRKWIASYKAKIQNPGGAGVLK